MNFEQISVANLARANRWHPGGLRDWSVADWASATGGEAGETANALKKLKRAQQHISQAVGPKTIQEATAHVGNELADTVLYLNLSAHRVGTTLPDCIALVEDEDLTYTSDISLGQMGCDLMGVVGIFCEQMAIRDHDADRDQKPDEILMLAIGRVFMALRAISNSLGLDLEFCVVETFNKVSVREGFPERLDLKELREAA